MTEKLLFKGTLFKSKVFAAQFFLNRLGVTRPFKTDVGSLSGEEEIGLRNLLEEASKHPGPIVEIGTLIGATTMKMALWAPQKQVITVDNYIWNAWGFSSVEHYALARHSLFSLVSQGRVKQVNMDKAEFYATYSDDPPSLVFLDAMHTYEETKKDIDWAISVGAEIITGHDYSEEWPGVVQAVKEAGGAKELYQSLWRL